MCVDMCADMCVDMYVGGERLAGHDSVEYSRELREAEQHGEVSEHRAERLFIPRLFIPKIPIMITHHLR